MMIQKELLSFIELLDSKDHSVRAAVAKLINKINDLGLIQPIDASRIFIKMLNDCNYESYVMANNSLKRLAQKKYQLVSINFSPQDILLEAYRYQKVIYSHPKLDLTSAFVKILD